MVPKKPGRRDGLQEWSARIGGARGVVTSKGGTALAMTKKPAHPKFCNDSAQLLLVPGCFPSCSNVLYHHVRASTKFSSGSYRPSSRRFSTLDHLQRFPHTALSWALTFLPRKIVQRTQSKTGRTFFAFASCSGKVLAAYQTTIPPGVRIRSTFETADHRLCWSGLQVTCCGFGTSQALPGTRCQITTVEVFFFSARDSVENSNSRKRVQSWRETLWVCATLRNTNSTYSNLCERTQFRIVSFLFVFLFKSSERRGGGSLGRLL